MNSHCLWLKDAPPDPREPPDLPPRADVAIIGGGYTGVAAARALARAGASAVVLERETLGWGASTRNGGFVLPGFKQDLQHLINRVGPDRARLLFEETRQALAHLEALIADAGISCGYRRSGHVTLAETSRELRMLEDEQHLLHRSFGYGTGLLGGSDIGGEIGSASYCGGLLDERAASVQPAQLFNGLAESARAAGALLAPYTEARKIRQEGGAFVVETARGALHATHLLVATNGYSGPVHREFRRRIVPIGSHIVATVPLGRALARELIPRDRVLNDSRNLLHYFRLSDDGRLVFGGRATFRPSRGESDREAASILQRDMVSIFPQLGQTPVEYAWSGNVAFTRDQMPHAGPLEGALCAGGYCGHGVAMAIYLGDRIGQHLAGRADLPLLAALDFPVIPLYNGRPWFLPLVGAWFRLVDRTVGR